MGEPGTYPPGAVIFEQGGTADCVLLVRSGRVRVAARRAGGEEHRAGRARAGRAARRSVGHRRAAALGLGDRARRGARPGRAAARVPRLPDGPPARRDLAAGAALAPPARGRGAPGALHGTLDARRPRRPAGRRAGAPLAPGPVLAAPFHLQGEKDAAPYGYGRDGNPTWTAVEAALGALEDAESVLFSSGMAAVCAVLEPALGAGDVLVAVARRLSGRPQRRQRPARAARRRGALRPHRHRGDRRRLRRCDARLDRDAVEPGARRLRHRRGRGGRPRGRCPPRGRQHARHAAGPAPARPRRRRRDVQRDEGALRPLGPDPRRGRLRDPDWAAALRKHRSQGGAIAGPFEAWLLHRSLATLGLRLERQSANALALARFLRDRPDVLRRPPPRAGGSSPARARGPPDAPRRAARRLHARDAERAQRFLAACALVAEATSFGGVHATAERRARWGTDAVAEGFIRFSAGCEDADDLLADVEQALEQQLRGLPPGRPLKSTRERRIRGSGGTRALWVRRPCRGGAPRSGRSVERRVSTSCGPTLARPWREVGTAVPSSRSWRLGVRLDQCGYVGLWLCARTTAT